MTAPIRPLDELDARILSALDEGAALTNRQIAEAARLPARRVAPRLAVLSMRMLIVADGGGKGSRGSLVSTWRRTAGGSAALARHRPELAFWREIERRAEVLGELIAPAAAGGISDAQAALTSCFAMLGQAVFCQRHRTVPPRPEEMEAVRGGLDLLDALFARARAGAGVAEHVNGPGGVA